jgi:hypothetical protein
VSCFCFSHSPQGFLQLAKSASKSFYQLLTPDPTHDPAGFVVEVSAAPSSKFLKPGPGCPHVLHSSTDTSPMSDSRNIAARVAMLKRKMELHNRKLKSLDKWKCDIEKRLKKLEV